MSKLYSVHSLVRDFRFQGKQYEEVKINWFVADRKAPLADYAALIQDYSQLGEEERVFPEEYVNEQFSSQEAEALKKYLDSQPTTTTRIDAIELPVMANSSGCRRLAAASGVEFFPLYKGRAYSLPFKVEGYFSLRFAEPSIRADDRATVIGRRP